MPVFAGASASGATTNCFHSRSECARANSRDSASRLPMRLTATRNASSPARPASVSADELVAQMSLEFLHVGTVNGLPAA